MIPEAFSYKRPATLELGHHQHLGGDVEREHQGSDEREDEPTRGVRTPDGGLPCLLRRVGLVGLTQRRSSRCLQLTHSVARG